MEVDQWQNTVAAGGVVLHGLHATVAPRRGLQAPPVLEQFSFVPYERTSILSPELQQYAQEVIAFAASGLKRVVENNKSVCNADVLGTVMKQMSSPNTASEENVARYLSQEDQNGLIKVYALKSRVCVHVCVCSCMCVCTYLSIYLSLSIYIYEVCEICIYLSKQTYLLVIH